LIGEKAVAGDAPRAVLAFLEDEELLVGFGGHPSARSMRGGPGGIGSHIGPSRGHDDQFRDREFHVELELAENGVVRLPYGLLADC
jgi:hypothetical protein